MICSYGNFSYLFLFNIQNLCATLSFADWLIVERSRKDNFMRQTKIRLVLLLPPVIISLVFAIVPLFYDMYNIVIVFCFLALYPPGCDYSFNGDCSRGEMARLAQTLQFAYTMACNVAIIIFMSLRLFTQCTIKNAEATHIYHQGREEIESSQTRQLGRESDTHLHSLYYTLWFMYSRCGTSLTNCEALDLPYCFTYT